jgi:hypothetical protein
MHNFNDFWAAYRPSVSFTHHKNIDLRPHRLIFYDASPVATRGLRQSGSYLFIAFRHDFAALDSLTLVPWISGRAISFSLRTAEQVPRLRTQDREYCEQFLCAPARDGMSMG